MGRLVNSAENCEVSSLLLTSGSYISPAFPQSTKGTGSSLAQQLLPVDAFEERVSLHLLRIGRAAAQPLRGVLLQQLREREQPTPPSAGGRRCRATCSAGCPRCCA